MYLEKIDTLPDFQMLSSEKIDTLLFSRICLSNEDDSGLLVASGIAGRQNDHALDVCRLALDILSKCATFEVKHRPSLREVAFIKEHVDCIVVKVTSCSSLAKIVAGCLL